MQERRIETPDGLDTLVDEILSILPQKKSANALALQGELGAGKTAFTQRLAQKIGVHEHVTSPTFVIMKAYEANGKPFQELIHIDAYRIEDIREAEILNIRNCFTESSTIVCIEWPERIASIIPDDALTVTFTPQDGGARIVTYG